MEITIFMCGDVMTGRGIDRVLPPPVVPTLYEPCIRDARVYVWLAEERTGPIEAPVAFEDVWGDALEVLERLGPSFRLINLETSITESDVPWVGKHIHYRLPPANIRCLTSAGIECCVLANNHLYRFAAAFVDPGSDQAGKGGHGLLRIGALSLDIEGRAALGGQGRQVENALAVDRIAPHHHADIRTERSRQGREIRGRPHVETEWIDDHDLNAGPELGCDHERLLDGDRYPLADCDRIIICEPPPRRWWTSPPARSRAIQDGDGKRPILSRVIEPPSASTSDPWRWVRPPSHRDGAVPGHCRHAAVNMPIAAGWFRPPRAIPGHEHARATDVVTGSRRSKAGQVPDFSIP
jgi:Bacterial capsule synthesis protein PGA_cap